MQAASVDAEPWNGPSTGFEELDRAIERYVRKHPKSRALHERARGPMPGGNTRTALHIDPFPIYLADSEEATVTDVDGATYLDALGEYTAGLFGHSDPTIRAATEDALRRGAGNGGPAVEDIRLAELICGRFPSIERVRFCNSGTEANLYALSLARTATGRETVVAFSGAYHGGLLNFGARGRTINVPFGWRLGRYNDPEAVRFIDATAAAVVVEPMMTNAGCIPATPSFLEALRARCDAVGAILVFDEVVTSRMSAGGLQERLGIRPDLTTLGKYMGGGFSFGAFGGRADLVDLMDPTRPDAVAHAGTFNNNVFSMSAGLAALGSVFTPERAERLYADGEALRSRLDEAARSHQAAVRFTGCGSVMNVHFTRHAIQAPEDTAGESRELVRLFHLDMLDAGIYCAARGQINLSLPMGSADFERIEAAVAGFLNERAAAIRRLAG